MEFLVVVPLPSTNSETLPVDVEILNDPTSVTYPAKRVNLVQSGNISIWMYSRDSTVQPMNLSLTTMVYSSPKVLQLLMGKVFQIPKKHSTNLRKTTPKFKGITFCLGWSTTATEKFSLQR